MTPTLSQKLTAKALKNGNPSVPSVSVEKSSVSEDGSYAKILFSIGTTKELAKKLVSDRKSLSEVFENKLEGSARLVVSSVHPSDVDGMYIGFLKLNRETMSFQMKDRHNLRSITANMFADPEDNIWNLEESADGKILVRNSEDDLQQILNTRIASPRIAVAAAGYDLNGIITAGQIVAYYDNVNEEIRKGIAVDNSTVYDFKFNKMTETASCDLVASTPVYDPSIVVALDALYNNKNTTYKECASATKDNIRRYLTKLYSQNKAYLDAYLASIDRLLSA